MWRTVDFLERAILENLGRHRAGLTLKPLVDAVANAMGDWPEESWGLARFSVMVHMNHLELQGKVEIKKGSQPWKWELV